VRSIRLLVWLLPLTLACHPDPDYRSSWDEGWGDDEGWGHDEGGDEKRRRPAGASGCERFLGLAEDAAEASGVELALIMGVMRVESHFRADARSSAGAVGLMQVMPDTGRHYRCGDLWDPEDNVHCGARVLQKNLAATGDLTYALAAYNAGLGNARAWQRDGRTPPNIGYVRKVVTFRDRFARGGCGAMSGRCMQRPLAGGTDGLGSERAPGRPFDPGAGFLSKGRALRGIAWCPLATASERPLVGFGGGRWVGARVAAPA